MKTGQYHPIKVDDAELIDLPEEIVAQLSRSYQRRWVELRAFAFRAERLLQKLAAKQPDPVQS